MYLLCDVLKKEINPIEFKVEEMKSFLPDEPDKDLSSGNNNREVNTCIMNIT